VDLAVVIAHDQRLAPPAREAIENDLRHWHLLFFSWSFLIILFHLAIPSQRLS
jgi:hypothetical protein